MLDLEEQLKVLGRALDAEAPAVTADEARGLAGQGAGRPRFGRGTTLRWPLAVAAAVLLVVGIAAAIVQGGDDESDVVTAEPGGYPLDLDGHRDWMVALLNGEADTSDSVLGLRFAPEFLTQVPPDQVRDIRRSLTDGAPWTVSTEVERRDDVLVTQLVGEDGSTLRLTLQLEASRRIVASTVLVTADCGELIPADEAQIASDPQLAWAFELVNGDRVVTDAELDEHLADSFTRAMSADEFRVALDEIRAIGPFVPRWFQGPRTPNRTVLVVGTASGEEARLVVQVDSAGQIDALNLMTREPCALA